MQKDATAAMSAGHPSIEAGGGGCTAPGGDGFPGAVRPETGGHRGAGATGISATGGG
jgi:hypothetical protein